MTWEEGGPGGSDPPGPEHVSDAPRARLSLVELLAGRARLRFTRQIAKVPHTRRWPVTSRGHKILGACVRRYDHGLSAAA